MVKWRFSSYKFGRFEKNWFSIIIKKNSLRPSSVNSSFSREAFGLCPPDSQFGKLEFPVQGLSDSIATGDWLFFFLLTSLIDWVGPGGCDNLIYKSYWIQVTVYILFLRA